MSTTAPASPREILKIERRSFIIGTLVILAVIEVTITWLQMMMEPELIAGPLPTSISAMVQRMVTAQAKLGWQQQMVLDVVSLVGAVALFFLNWRFSFLLQRPRSAFQTADRFSPRRLGWWLVLFLNSMFYTSLVVPQIALTWLLARWGTQELERMPPPSHEINA